MVNSRKIYNYTIFNPRIIKHHIGGYTTYLLYHLNFEKYEQSVNITPNYLTNFENQYIISLER